LLLVSLEHSWLLVPLIVLARVGDVTLGTIRTISLFRGQRLLAAVLGFFEVLIWLGAAAQVFRNLDRWHLAVAYAAGFGLGNYVGCWVEGKLAVGLELVRIVSMDPESRIGDVLENRGYEIIELQGRNGSAEKADVVLAVEPRRKMASLLQLVRDTDPNAIWTLSDVRRHVSASASWNRRDLRSRRWLQALRK
jgi:uncharacterized protein YebE (UPF0316 family)